MHPAGVLRSLPNSISHRLVKLTSNFDSKSTIKDTFPNHYKAMRNANLIAKNFKYQNKPLENSDLKKRRDSRKIYFPLAFAAPHWHQMPHEIIKKNLDKFGLKFRVSMSYSKFRNLESIFRGDATRKILKNYEDSNFSNFPCNCHGGVAKCKVSAPDSRGKCRHKGVIYGIECLLCTENDKNLYVGSTQRDAKTRISEHLSDLKKVVKSFATDTILKIDSFTSHFVKHHKNALPPDLNMDKLRSITSGSVLKYNLAYGLGSPSCGLCKMEKFYIWDRSDTLMNTKSELFNMCRHKSKLVHYKNRY